MRLSTATTLLFGLAAAACSSQSNDPFGPDPDFTTEQAKFDHPTGTFRRGSELTIIGASQGQSTSSGFAMGGLASPSTSTSGSGSGGTAASSMQSLRILDGNSTTTSTSTWCPAIKSGDGSGTCACPGGGSLAYDFSGVAAIKNHTQTGPIDVTARVHASQCTVDGNSIDGSEYVNLRTSTATPTASDLFFLILIRLDVKLAIDPAVHHLDLDALYDGGRMWLAVAVDDGYVVIATAPGWDATTKTGTVYVRDREASWTCTLTNGSGSCTSDTGGTRTLQP